jgi:hypothetical protein
MNADTNGYRYAYDVLDVPAEAGFAVLDRFPATGPGGPVGPVALRGRRMQFLVAPGGAEELPGLLEWLEWSGIPLDLVPLNGKEAACHRYASVWLRPPEPGGWLPAIDLGAFAAGAAGVGLTALVSALANACHRVRLLRCVPDQPCAFSYASRMVAGTRPRSLTS